MPVRNDPQPEDNEVECARCGATFYYELTRCPSCGVNIYEPEDETHEALRAESSARQSPGRGLRGRLITALKRLFKVSPLAEELFGEAKEQRALYEDLLRKVGGDHDVIERLVQFERERVPDANRTVWLRNAIWRWERDNR